MLDQNDGDAEIACGGSKHLALPCPVASGRRPARRAKALRASCKCACDLDQAAIDVRQVAGKRRERAVVSRQTRGAHEPLVRLLGCNIRERIAKMTAAERRKILSMTLIAPKSCVV